MGFSKMQQFLLNAAKMQQTAAKDITFVLLQFTHEACPNNLPSVMHQCSKEAWTSYSNMQKWKPEIPTHFQTKENHDIQAKRKENKNQNDRTERPCEVWNNLNRYHSKLGTFNHFPSTKTQPYKSRLINPTLDSSLFKQKTPNPSRNHQSILKHKKEKRRNQKISKQNASHNIKEAAFSYKRWKSTWTTRWNVEWPRRTQMIFPQDWTLQVAPSPPL